ncbi:hypothetical protein JXD20_04260 [Candidatus Peregrinibacteria bacterium]|nr:hypothetical protein [Candidatus Peregrinibacteria bacterium]
MNNKVSKFRPDKKGSSLVELIIVTILFAIFIPVSVGIFIGGRKITGQSYIQHAAAITLTETTDILEFIRNDGFATLTNGSFYLIRNPGNNSWLVKSELPDKDTFERFITVSNALRHESNDDLFLEGDVGTSYADSSTKRIDIEILWAPDYIPLDLISRTFYVSDWQNDYIYPSS